MNRSSNSVTGSRSQRAAKRRWLACASLALAFTQLNGCAQKVRQTPYADQNGSEGPQVLSADPQGDAAALRESDEVLTKVKWGVIEKRGPKTPWEQFGFGRRSHEDQPGSQAASQARAEAEPEPSGMLVMPPPSTQPATTQPAAPPVPTYVYPEGGLPLRAMVLPDGRVRLIWTMRNYGGTNVTSTREPQTSRRNVTLGAPDMTPLVAVVTSVAGPGATVVPLPRENMLVITCSQAFRGQVVEMLAKIDVPPRQVQIAAKIFEVSHDFDFQQGAQVLAKRIGDTSTQEGVSIFNTQRALDASQGNTPFQGSVFSLMKTFEKQGISIETSFQLLADAGLIRLVSSPRMTVAAGQTGYLLAGQELPVQTANLVNSSVLTTSTQYKPVGVQLYITPQVIGPDRVKLHTISIVSSVSGFAPLPTLSGDNSKRLFINPIIDSREAETAVTITDGDTLVISGLRMSRTTTRENKIPGLGDIPVLGWLFKNHRTQQTLTDLYFFVTPTLL